ncbi:MAG: VOC family protein [Dehalococcoidia bacterium]
MPAGTMPAMRVSQFLLNLTSERPARLFRFYRDTLGLEEEEFMGHAVKAGGATLMFDSHSQVHGGAREPQRYLINLVVDDLSAEQARIEALGVSFIRRKGHEPWGARVSTLLDPDGNYVQLVEYHPEGMV